MSVRDELNLPGEVRDSIDEVLRSAPPRGRGMPRSPGDTAAFQEHLKRETELLSGLSPEQTTRLQQIAWQQRGAFALGDPEVAAALELTEGQRQEVRQTLDDYRRRAFGRRRGPAEGGNDDSTQKTEERLWQVVTDSQRATWQGMIGEPFRGSVSTEVARELRQSGFGPRPFRPR
jgi:hypothetical protein